MKTPIIVAFSLFLGGCAASATQYSRADGRLDAGHMQLTLAQCRGEGATSVRDYVGGEGPVPWAFGVASRSQKEETIVRACMARNGYLTQ